jgi:hypothetical protein
LAQDVFYDENRHLFVAWDYHWADLVISPKHPMASFLTLKGATDKQDEPL